MKVISDKIQAWQRCLRSKVKSSFSAVSEIGGNEFKHVNTSFVSSQLQLASSFPYVFNLYSTFYFVYKVTGSSECKALTKCAVTVALGVVQKLICLEFISLTLGIKNLVLERRTTLPTHVKIYLCRVWESSVPKEFFLFFLLACFATCSPTFNTLQLWEMSP